MGLNLQFAREREYELYEIFLGILLLLVVLIVTAWIIIKIVHFIFKGLQRNGKALHLVFLERVVTALVLVGVVLVLLFIFAGDSPIMKTALGGTAIASAVIGFAAQDIFKDILAGLMMSIYRPIELGNRIVLENGSSGIVKDITMRHVVLQFVDSQILIVPNSKLNSMSLWNYSYHSEYRSKYFTFNVSYDTDVELAQRVIRKAIMSSKYSIPGKKTDRGMEYGPVYFMGYAPSSLILTTTVYYEAASPTEVVTSDIHMRVNYALNANHIEIPYDFINLVERTEATEDEGDNKAVSKAIEIFHTYTDEIRIAGDESVEKALTATEKFGKDSGLSRKEILRLRLLAEELFGLMRGIAGDVAGYYRVERESMNFMLHLRASVSLTKEMRQQFAAVSSTDKSAPKGFMDRMRDMIGVMLLPTETGTESAAPEGVMGLGMSLSEIRQAQNTPYQWSMNKYKTELSHSKEQSSESSEAWDELEKSIIANIADEIGLNIIGSSVEITVVKEF